MQSKTQITHYEQVTSKDLYPKLLKYVVIFYLKSLNCLSVYSLVQQHVPKRLEDSTFLGSKPFLSY